MPREHPVPPPEEAAKEARQAEVREEAFPGPEEFVARLRDFGLDQHAHAYEKTLELARAIEQRGGTALLVGGSVRDSLMGAVSKDFDVEVYGLEAGEVEQVVSGIGTVSEVGKAFGILKVSLPGGMDIDVSLPRTDSKVAQGHRGFEVKTDPSMSVEDAARRRDFTMNSVAANPLTGELHDPFSGARDIRQRILRVTDAERFRDDPLRVLRALQFVGRFGMEIEPDTMDLLRQMAPELRELPKERIGEEWKKLLLKSEKPSLGLAAGMTLGVFREIHPEFPPLARTEQEPEWHPEGDVWIHTLMSVDQAAIIARRQQLDDQQSMTLLLATLCHDLGKPAVTEFAEGRIRSRGHEAAGEEPTRKFLATIGSDIATRDKVVSLVVNHLAPTLLYVDDTVRGNPISDGAIRRLAKRIHPATVRELALVAEADHLGRGNFEQEARDQLLLPADSYPAADWLLERARSLDVEDSKPADLTRGRDWIGLGYRPGPAIGELIRLSNDLRDDQGFSREMVLAAVEGLSSARQAIDRLKGLNATQRPQ